MLKCVLTYIEVENVGVVSMIVFLHGEYRQTFRHSDPLQWGFGL